MKWINVDTELPTTEGYYGVKFEDGTTDEKPFRIRPSKNIHGFMTMNKVIEWRVLSDEELSFPSEID